jgi:hypothetical protein
VGFFRKLKKGIKKVRKALKLPAITLGNVAKVAAVAGTGGLGAAGLGAAVLKSKLKSAAVGGIKQVLRTKGQKALVDKLKQLAPSGAAGAATTMPGGAPLRGKVAAARAVRPKKRKLYLTGKARRARERATLEGAPPQKAKRKAPSGGKDFKALSASWKAAGKPGTWLDWVKSH